jgi:hypothetical protein
MSQTFREPRNLSLPIRWSYAGSDPSRPGQRARRTVRCLIRFKRLPRCLLRFQSRQWADPPAASCRCYIHPPARRRYQISIAPAAPPVPNFPRLRALALFGRRPPQRAEGFVMPASKNLHKGRHCKYNQLG